VQIRLFRYRTAVPFLLEVIQVGDDALSGHTALHRGCARLRTMAEGHNNKDHGNDTPKTTSAAQSR
jgi:hypothetical protein